MKSRAELENDFHTMIAAVDRDNPDPAALAQLRGWLETTSVADKLGNLCAMARNRVLDHSFTKLSTREFVLAHLRMLRDELDYDNAGALERSLIEHVIMCWVRLHDCEMRYNSAVGASMTVAAAMYWERKLSMNQRRYLKACESLARVRRLNLSINVNIAQQQIVNTR